MKIATLCIFLVMCLRAFLEIGFRGINPPFKLNVYVMQPKTL